MNDNAWIGRHYCRRIQNRPRFTRRPVCVVGYNALLVHDFDRPINVVTGYDPNGPVNRNLRTVTPALAYEDARTGETVILVVHQAIYIPDIGHNLLSDRKSVV